MQNKFHYYGEMIHLSLSMGIASYPDHAKTAEQLIHVADQTMYRAKSSLNNIIVASNSHI